MVLVDVIVIISRSFKQSNVIKQNNVTQDDWKNFEVEIKYFPIAWQLDIPCLLSLFFSSLSPKFVIQDKHKM